MGADMGVRRNFADGERLAGVARAALGPRRNRPADTSNKHYPAGIAAAEHHLQASPAFSSASGKAAGGRSQLDRG
jgi:hypothetical protein